MLNQPDPWHGNSVYSRGDWLPFFNVRKVGLVFVLTNRMGDWDIVSTEEMKTIYSSFTPKPLIDRLAKKRLVIREDNATDILPEWRRFGNAIDVNGPQLHIIHLTQRCNLGCSYCHSAAIPVDAKGRDLQVDTALRIAKFIRNMPSRRLTVNFQGGEPTLMYGLIDQIMRELRIDESKTINASITTNGTLLADLRVQEVLQKHSISVSVSLDGPKEVHDEIRVYRDGLGSYDDAVRGRSILQTHDRLQLSGSIMVLTRKGMNRTKEIIDEYVRLGQSSLHIKPVTKLGFGKSHWDDVGLSFEEYWDAYKSSLEYMIKLQEEGILIIELQVRLALQMLFDGLKPVYVDFRNPCGLVYGVLNYDIDGKIYGCHEGKRKKDFLIGDVDSSPIDLLLSPEAQNLASSSILDQHSECRACTYLPFCAPCPASSHQATGSTTMRPFEDFHCRFTLNLFDWLFEKIQNDPEPLMRWWRQGMVTQALAGSP